MLIGDMGIARLMIHVQQVEEEKLNDRQEFKNKRYMTSGNEFGQQKSNANRSSFQHKQKGSAPLSASAPAPRNKYAYNSQNSQNFKARPVHSQGSKAQGGTKTLAYAKCGRSHSGMCRDGSTGCFKCVKNGHFKGKCPKSRQSNGNGAIDHSLLQLLHQTELHLDERLQGQEEKKTIFMLSLVPESKRILQLLSLV
ncbi:hypothetical protein MTR67_031556 [Solanum verrucosum]|uniref:CCHC-type domain-containing protein n=1 Tax=Solanum verrucosum TaxID=315347 RepID=A0AAF0U2S9_SOLVR|nr:hypothetical protein MTR67_031556 [Solanum verrucosum]